MITQYRTVVLNCIKWIKMVYPVRIIYPHVSQTHMDPYGPIVDVPPPSIVGLQRGPLWNAAPQVPEIS